MAILIKGMEMPKSCFLCRFCRRQEYGEYVGEDTAWSCVASKKRITDGRDLIATFKHPDCPLVEAVEVQDAVSRQPNLQPTCNQLATDLISRQALMKEFADFVRRSNNSDFAKTPTWNDAVSLVGSMPSAQPEACEYYALCRHGRDENKLRTRFGICEYCHEDSDGFVTPLEKNGHAFVRFGMDGWELSLKANGWHGSAKIRYCPMCGRDLHVK